MYHNHGEILKLIDAGVIANYDLTCVNTASFDVRLGDKILVEVPHCGKRVINYRNRDTLTMKEVDISNGYLLEPGEFILGCSMEVFDFPDDLAALYRIKSSMGRIGFEHMDAGWIDPGFEGSLTLEFSNMTRFHTIEIFPGDRVGQIIFIKGEEVEKAKSYRNIGNYNGELKPVQIRFQN